MEKDNICKFSNTSSSDLICTRFVYENTNAQSHNTYTDSYILGFITDGKALLQNDTSVFNLSKGQAFFINPNTNFSISNEDGLSYFYITFYGRRADELARRSNIDTSPFSVFEMCENCEEITAFALNCLNRANGQNTDILGECTLLYLFSFLTAEEKKNTNLLSSIIRLTEENFTDYKFSLNALGKLMNYDAKYLSFYFKKHKQVTYSEYLRDLRIKHAVFLIEQGLTSVKNIGMLSGFGDALYFSKVFKTVTKKSPKEYIAYWSENTETL